MGIFLFRTPKIELRRITFFTSLQNYTNTELLKKQSTGHSSRLQYLIENTYGRTHILTKPVKNIILEKLGYCI